MRITPPWLKDSWSDLASCSLLGPWVQQMDPPTLNEPEDLFEDLVSSIVYQQLSGKAAGAIWARFVALFPEGQPVPPSELRSKSVEELRAVGLSRQKASYVVDLAERVHNGVLPLDSLGSLSDEEVHLLLTQVKGIGPWTADMMLIFSLHRPDVFPSLDLGIKRGLQRALGVERDLKPQEMMEAADRWKPYRSAASMALWRVADTPSPTAAS
jgi:DNA-3-methyladenine glycosylase II